MSFWDWAWTGTPKSAPCGRSTNSSGCRTTSLRGIIKRPTRPVSWKWLKQRKETVMTRLWLSFVAVLVLSFFVLGWVGTRIYQQMPPIADRIVTMDGTVIVDAGEIAKGQNVWQSLGGMELGSV